MNFTYLMWGFALLFVVTGLPLSVTEDARWQNLWGGLSAISLGLFALSMAADGLIKGRVRFNFSILDRTSQPHLFHGAIGLVCITGVSVIAATLWVIFLK